MDVKILLDEEAMRRAIARISHEIIEKNKGVENIVLVGVRTKGYPLAQRIANYIKKIEDVELNVGSVDLTLYRDDLSTKSYNPILQGTEIHFDINGKTIVLVDDVLFTGRTIRAGLDALIDMGRPKAIQLAVLVDRGHRELPIRADYVGKSIPTATNEIINVYLHECDEEEMVVLSKIN